MSNRFPMWALMPSPKCPHCGSQLGLPTHCPGRGVELGRGPSSPQAATPSSVSWAKAAWAAQYATLS